MKELTKASVADPLDSARWDDHLQSKVQLMDENLLALFNSSPEPDELGPHLDVIFDHPSIDAEK